MVMVFTGVQGERMKNLRKLADVAGLWRSSAMAPFWVRPSACLYPTSRGTWQIRSTALVGPNFNTIVHDTHKMTDTTQKGRFEPKEPVQLAPPKDDPITLEYLAKCDGMSLQTTLLRAGL